MFFKWLTLDNFNRERLKFIIEQNKNTEVKTMVLALEQWDHFQNYGMCFLTEYGYLVKMHFLNEK